jgi:hypothetical protein
MRPVRPKSKPKGRAFKIRDIINLRATDRPKGIVDPLEAVWG